MGGCELEPGQLVDVVHGAQPIGRVHQEGVRVQNELVTSAEIAKHVGDVGRDLKRGLRVPGLDGAEALPAHDADPRTLHHPGRF